ncbi:helix-turn-helix domain-containing protein [Tenacibaculum sp. AHE15PA]|uniref:helix-turn-helix domain-containing protein n=1 Tax=unclassified Tenacibaculum TaxID=2635139 RepID=UPI001C4E581C|nr:MULTISPECIES: helix-turn-helix domain-containing protein [unclassified Tenacibaculum]QXP72517.1 helix-turn-helix domain-containing protein [Tenacibaculum sp. AHE14PA]QXP76432.1 helix-turn-helix domain-containing protein [Tenacibaculum sp. AHE15PA]
MNQVQLIGITQEEHHLPIFRYIDKKIDELKKLCQPKEPVKYLTRHEVAEMLSMDISSVHNMSKKGILQKHQISGRILYIRSEVEDSIIKLI